MSTKKHEGENLTESMKREEAAKREHAEKKHQGTDDPMASPPFDVHGPNPESTGEK